KFQLDISGPLSQLAGSTSLGGPVRFVQIATGQTADKHMEMFGLGADHVVYYRYQTTSSSTSWSNWWHLPTWYAPSGSSDTDGYAQSITVTNEQNGQLDLFILGTNNAVYYNSQIAPVAWTGWTGLGGNILSFVVGQHSNGAFHTNLEVFAVNTQHQYSHK